MPGGGAEPGTSDSAAQATPRAHAAASAKAQPTVHPRPLLFVRSQRSVCATKGGLRRDVPRPSVCLGVLFTVAPPQKRHRTAWPSPVHLPRERCSPAVRRATGSMTHLGLQRYRGGRVRRPDCGRAKPPADGACPAQKRRSRRGRSPVGPGLLTATGRRCRQVNNWPVAKKSRRLA